MQLHAPPLLSRIILAVSAIVAVGIMFIFISRSLEPSSLPPPPPPKQAQAFNPKADVSRHKVFADLESTHMYPVPDLPMGRENPFIAIDKIATTTISAEGVAIPGSRLRVMPAVPEPVRDAVGESATGTQNYE